MTKKQYRVELSKVTVTFVDGEVKSYIITASPAIGGHLAREAGVHGVLSLYNGERSFGIPMSQIRDWEIEPFAEVAPDAPAEGEAA
jgi:hypothetical protein